MMEDTDNRQIEYIALEELITRLHPQNAKEHNIGAIIESYRHHGYVASGVIDARTNLFLAGHGRIAALNMMRKQGMEAPRGIRNGGDDWLVPVQVGYESENDSAALAYLVADNKLTIDGGWNEPALAELLQEVHNSGEIAIEATGFDADGLDELLRDLGQLDDPVEDPGAQVDRAAELQKKWQVQRGDVWVVGKHRVMCGDSTNADDVERLMGGVKAAVISDPPYGVNVVQNNSVGGENLAPVGMYAPIVNDETTDSANSFYNTCIDYGIDDFILWGGNYFTDFLPPSPCWIIWDKRGDIPGNNFADCEIAWTSFDRPSRLYKQIWRGMIREGESGKRFHPTQKPIGLMAYCIGFVESSVIYDGFLGSGSMIVACEQTGRVGYGMEIAPEYVAVTLERLSQMGLTPELADDTKVSN